MKTQEISFNSRADLERQISTFQQQHPRALLDEAQINPARTRATEMDNDGSPVGQRISIKVNYTET